LNNLPVLGAPPFALLGNDAQLRSSTVLAAINLGINGKETTVKKLRANVAKEFEENMLAHLNLPTSEDLAELTEENEDSYAEATNANHLFSPNYRANLNRSRASKLSSDRAKIEVELKEEFEGKNLKNPKIAREFKEAASKKVLQNRLNTINKLTDPNRDKWFKNIPAKLGVDASKLKIAGGFMAFAGLSAAVVNHAAITQFISTQASSLTAWIAKQTNILPSIFSYAGTASSAVGGFMIGQQLANMGISGKFSAGKMRNRQQVMGSTDASGVNTGGLGNLDIRAGTYNPAQVQSALANQLANAEKNGLTFAKTHSKKDIGLLTGGSESLQKHYKTADYLWEREQAGLQAIIQRNINTTSLNTAIPKDQKNNVTIANALDEIYATGGVEETFLTSYETARDNNGYGRAIKNFAFAPTVAASFAGMFSLIV
jgi:hypothetical protein